MEIRLANHDGNKSKLQFIIYSTLPPVKYVRVEIADKWITISFEELKRAIEAISGKEERAL